MISITLEQRLKFLTYFAVCSSFLIVVLFILVFNSGGESRYKKVITERLEVVDSEGDPIILLAGPQSFPRAKERSPDRKPEDKGTSGIVFYDGEDQEIGAFTISATKTDSGRHVTTQFKLDRWGSNAVLGIGHEETPSFRSTGFLINQQLGSLPNTDTRRRATFGATSDGKVLFQLQDIKARPRIVMQVDSSGTASLIFMDEGGNITDRYPSTD